MERFLHLMPMVLQHGRPHQVEEVEEIIHLSLQLRRHVHRIYSEISDLSLIHFQYDTITSDSLLDSVLQPRLLVSVLNLHPMVQQLLTMDDSLLLRQLPMLHRHILMQHSEVQHLSQHKSQQLILTT